MIEARVLPAASVADFIGFLERETSSFTTLVVCSTREYFIEQLIANIAERSQLQDNNLIFGDEPSPSQETEAQAAGEINRLIARDNGFKAIDTLLSNSMGAISNSRKIELVFCPSVPHLRAYLATFQLRSLQKNTVKHKDDTAGGRKALIAILDIIALHCTSTQFSAQGLSQTLALAVESAARTKSAIMLCECEEASNPGSRNHGQILWDSQVPLLNGGTVRSGHAQEPSGAHISVRRLAQRWFQFEE